MEIKCQVQNSDLHRLFGSWRAEAAAAWPVYSGDGGAEVWFKGLGGSWGDESIKDQGHAVHPWGASGLVLWEQPGGRGPQQWRVSL